ncbi:MAG: DNA polymerase I [Chromatiales bacterium]|jgi:DNA polymerase I|nr:DNA polymerase I [Chromatiales bacterium]
MTTQSERLVLVDGSSYLYRAFHAMPSLTNSRNEPTGATYGVVNMMRRLLEDFKPDFLGVVFDAPGKTFRDDMYSEYKANRPSMPDELRSQIPVIHAIVEAMGFPLIMVTGVEADDVIGTLSHAGSAAGLEVIISTGDKDMAQLVVPGVKLVNTMDGSEMDEAGVEKKFGVRPNQIIDYLTLVGDTVDNVPGVPKVGPKTAVKWLAAYDSLDGVIAAAGDIKGKVGENLRDTIPKLALSRDLVTIKCDVNLDRGPRDLALKPQETDTLREHYARMEFRTWLGELLDRENAESAADVTPVERGEYECVLTKEALDSWVMRLREAPLIAIDTETTSVNPMQAKLVGISVSVEVGGGAYIPVAHRYAGAPEQLDIDYVLERLRPILEDPSRQKLGQHIKYDMTVLARHGIHLAGVQFDTMLESYVLDSTGSRHDMDSLALKYLSYRTVHFEDIAGKGAKQLTFDQIPLEEAADYAAEDADITLRLHQVLRPRVEQHDSLRGILDDIEMPLTPVLARMEQAGVLVDARLLGQQSARLASRMMEVEQAAYEAAGHPFNLGSPKQIQTVLYDELELPVLAKTPKKQPSTAESVLAELAHDHALPKLILEHRELAKLKSTYTDALPECIDSGTGRVHTSYRQAVAATGRLSSSDPNLQNIPVRSEEGRLIREAFVAPPGTVLLAADYSQIELRIMAHLSGDDGLRAAFAAGADVHAATAAEVFETGLDEVTSDQRRSAKAINFGLIYGMSAFGLGRQLGIGRSQAQEYVDVYFERYPGVKAYMDRVRSEARDKGYVETVFGRRLYLQEINSRNYQRRQYAERTAINAPMQGTAADIIKRAMLDVDAWIESTSPPARMIMQVHDELVFEVDPAALDDVAAQIRSRMCGAANLDVVLDVDIGIGATWAAAH